MGKRETIRATAPFGRLSEEILLIIENAGEWKELEAGEELFAFGDAGDTMYIVAEGFLQALVPGKHGEEIVVSELAPNSIIGEIQALIGGKRSATVRAKTPARLVRFERAMLDRLSVKNPEAVSQIHSMILRRLRRNQLAVILATYLGALPREQMQEIESLGEWLQLEQGEALFRQGDPPDSLFVLVSGSLGALFREADGTEKLVGRIRPGELVGEMSLLTDDPRSATVYAIREAELVRFSKQKFQPLFDKYPRFLREIARLNISRLKEARGSGERPPTSTVITLLPAPGAPVKEFGQQLARELAIYSSVLRLNSGNLDEILEMPGMAQAPKTGALNTRFAAWLSEQEEKYRFILLETDATATNWTRRCIRQSEQVITIGVGGADPSVAGLEGLLYGERQVGSVPKRLVLIHPADCERPSGTARWLESRQLEMHHHVRLGNREDFRRLARFLSGSAVCLALGGGGARGFAHIGAFRAFREAGIPIDIVGGTSMGAVLGAELAMGVDPEKMVELNRGLFRNSGLLMDLTLPLVSFTTGRAYANSLKQVFDDVAIEDLWIPFFCVSSNISRATMAVHRAGLLRQKVRASSGVQGLFPPMVINGDLHVDGALFSNLPADVMKSVCQGVVIAVDVTPPVDLAEHTDYGDTISGWKVLWHRLLEGEEPTYSVDLGTIMQRSAEAASMASQRRVIEKMADFYLLMPVHKVKLMNFKAIDRLSDIGYVTAKQKIEEWKPSLAWTLRDSGTQ